MFLKIKLAHFFIFIRYMLLHDTFQYYAANFISIDILEAVNLTAVVGDKGGSEPSDFLSCLHAKEGSNIVSSMFYPAADMMYLAFENGAYETHSPACCNPYVQLNMSLFWN